MSPEALHKNISTAVSPYMRAATTLPDARFPTDALAFSPLLAGSPAACSALALYVFFPTIFASHYADSSTLTQVVRCAVTEDNNTRITFQ